MIQESLDDPSILNDVEIVKRENKDKGWRVYAVRASLKEIENLTRHIKQGAWYTHSVKGKGIIISEDKQFKFDFGDNCPSKPVLECGMSISIPGGQVGFPIEDATRLRHE